jgi:hypothetical protein
MINIQETYNILVSLYMALNGYVMNMEIVRVMGLVSRIDIDKWLHGWIRLGKAEKTQQPDAFPKDFYLWHGQI